MTTWDLGPRAVFGPGSGQLECDYDSQLSRIFNPKDHFCLKSLALSTICIIHITCIDIYCRGLAACAADPGHSIGLAELAGSFFGIGTHFCRGLPFAQ